MVPGKFITFEGIEGVGKTSQIERAREFLEGLSIAVISTREPGGTALGEEIRTLLLNRQHTGMAPVTELLLMFAARNEHCERLIFPALAAGTWVISDRFVDASYAYQGGGRGIPAADIAVLEKLVLRAKAPDLTLLFDIPVDLALTRAAARHGRADRFEIERADFFEAARTCYLARAKAEPERFRIIDASATLDEVAEAVAAALRELIAA